MQDTNGHTLGRDVLQKDGTIWSVGRDDGFFFKGQRTRPLSLENFSEGQRTRTAKSDFQGTKDKNRPSPKQRTKIVLSKIKF